MNGSIEGGSEVEQLLKEGFHTFKAKVGKSADDDARRVKLIQRAIAGRAMMRRAKRVRCSLPP